MSKALVLAAVVVLAALAAAESLPCVPVAPRTDTTAVFPVPTLPSGPELGLREAPEAPIVTQ